MGIVAVVVVHDFDLPKMDGLKAGINIGSRLIVKPKPGLQPAFIRDLGIPAHGPPLAFGIDHVGIAKIPDFHRLP